MKCVKLFLSSPGDVQPERDIVLKVVNNLNHDFRKDYGIEIRVYRWEDVPRGLHEDGAQGVVDDEILPENCDIVIGILWKRYGTPTKGHGSGTEYELRGALNKWDLTKEPRIMLYFSMREDFMDNIDTSELGKVNELRKEFEQKGLVDHYKSVAQFENKIQVHLSQYIQNNYAPIISDNLELKSIPRFSGTIERRNSLKKLSEKVALNSMLLIQGISGSGKTYLLSAYLHSSKSIYNTEFVFWYKAGEADSLDKLFLGLEKEMEVPIDSFYSKSKYLFHYLKKHDGILVIDDFENVDVDLSKELIRAFAGMTGPARVILLSTRDSNDILYSPALYKVPGYSKEEVKELLNVNDIQLENKLIDQLLTVSNGIPVVVKLFVNCIVEAGYDPEDLLNGEFLEREDFENWYYSVENGLSDQERRLLSYLSLCDDLFDLKVVRSISEGRIDNYLRVFQGLQGLFLIDNYKKSNWRVHPFIAHRATRNIDDSEKTIIYRAIASDYHDRVGNTAKIFSLSNDEILYYIKAGRYFKKAGISPTVEVIVKDIRRLLKKRGDFGILYELTAPLADELIRDWWLDYHYAHSCLVLGKFRELKNKVVNLIQSAKIGEERILATKIYAELENICGDNDSAFSSLEDVINSREWSDLRKENIKNIVRLYKVNTLIRLNRLRSADNLRKKVFFKNRNPSNYSAAISHMLSAWIDYRKGFFQESSINAEKALAIFEGKRVNDNRGVAWSKEVLAIVNYEMGEMVLYMKYLYESLELRSKMNDCSLEYFDFIEEVLLSKANLDWNSSNQELLDLLNRESERVINIYKDIRKIQSN